MRVLFQKMGHEPEPGNTTAIDTAKRLAEKIAVK
jgi:hypothetical protein